LAGAIGRWVGHVDNIHQILSRWTDKVLLSPYSSAAFARVARRYGIGTASARFYAVVTAGLAILLLCGACALSATAAKAVYLVADGEEAAGKVLDVSFHTDTYGNRIRWKKLSYEFRVASGEVIKGQLDRPVHELTGMPEGDRFTVLYWARFPAINSPRGVHGDLGLIAVLAAFLLLCSLHFACLSRRFVRWRTERGPASIG
jgi:hypothetical protein